MNSIREIISKIKKRPEMYIGQNSISCLKAFLDGWYLRDPDNVIDSEIMDNFQDWVESRYKSDSAESWANIILDHAKNETEALKLFFKEFDEFNW